MENPQNIDGKLENLRKIFLGNGESFDWKSMKNWQINGKSMGICDIVPHFTCKAWNLTVGKQGSIHQLPG